MPPRGPRRQPPGRQVSQCLRGVSYPGARRVAPRPALRSPARRSDQSGRCTRIRRRAARTRARPRRAGPLATAERSRPFRCDRCSRSVYCCLAPRPTPPKSPKRLQTAAQSRSSPSCRCTHSGGPRGPPPSPRRTCRLRRSEGESRPDLCGRYSPTCRRGTPQRDPRRIAATTSPTSEGRAEIAARSPSPPSCRCSPMCRAPAPGPALARNPRSRGTRWETPTG